jgi:hypothetical protein
LDPGSRPIFTSEGAPQINQTTINFQIDFVQMPGCVWLRPANEGEVLDVLVQTKWNKAAALKLMRKLLKKYGFLPENLVTDDLRSYHAACPLNSKTVPYCPAVIASNAADSTGYDGHGY